MSGLNLRRKSRVYWIDISVTRSFGVRLTLLRETWCKISFEWKASDSVNTKDVYVFFFQGCHQYCMAKLFADSVRSVNQNRKATLKQKCSPDWLTEKLAMSPAKGIRTTLHTPIQSTVALFDIEEILSSSPVLGKQHVMIMLMCSTGNCKLHWFVSLSRVAHGICIKYS